MKTAKEKYQRHLKRTKEYEQEFRTLTQSLEISSLSKEKLLLLFEWFGHSRAMQSKEYQQLKKENE